MMNHFASDTIPLFYAPKSGEILFYRSCNAPVPHDRTKYPFPGSI